MGTPITHFVEALLHSGVLDPARQEEFWRAGLGHSADLRGLTEELLRRGWLTRFQLAALTSGRGARTWCAGGICSWTAWAKAGWAGSTRPGIGG